MKQILAANSEAIMARPPWLEEMEARRRATKPERDKARSLRREADVERRAAAPSRDMAEGQGRLSGEHRHARLFGGRTRSCA